MTIHQTAWKFAVITFCLLIGTVAASAQTVVLPNCVVDNVGRNYNNGDFRLTIRCGPNGTQKPVVGDKAQVTRPLPPVQAPIITAFTATPSSIVEGGSSVLSGALAGGTATALTLNGTSVMGQSSITVTPTATTVYTLTASNAGGSASRSVTVTVTAPPPVVVHCSGTWTSWAPVAPGAWSACVNGSQTRQEERSFSILTQPANGGTACPASPETRTVSQSCVVEPPPPTGSQVWGAVTAGELGECTAAQHDVFMGEGADGYRYRTYHPQRDPSGCIYGHEHGDDPALQTNAWVRANFNGLMGYAARRDSTMPGEPNGHMEPHNGYKIHVTNIGEVNDEGRINQTATTSMPHMGTGGPNRFNVDRHSVQIADWHQNGIHHTKIDGMFSTGVGGNSVCEPRVNPPTKDGLILGQGCKMDSSYEIWGMRIDIKRGTSTLLTKFVTPAVFDPITVHNKANPSELVYAWDPRVAAFKNFPNDWSGFRGCAREGYSQVGYHYTGGEASEELLMDVRTQQVVTVAGPYTTRLVIGRSNTGGNPPFSSNILQFKKRRDHCDYRSKLGLQN